MSERKRFDLFAIIFSQMFYDSFPPLLSLTLSLLFSWISKLTTSSYHPHIISYNIYINGIYESISNPIFDGPKQNRVCYSNTNIYEALTDWMNEKEFIFEEIECRIDVKIREICKCLCFKFFFIFSFSSPLFFRKISQRELSKIRNCIFLANFSFGFWFIFNFWVTFRYIEK